jgi:ABC-type transport system involved in multi-copper enzyme maturation permease subunit
VNREPLPLPRYLPPSAGRRFAGWLRRELAPSAFRRSPSRLGVALVLAAAVLLMRFGGGLVGWQQAVLWGALLVAVAALSRRGWLRLFGPVLFYDLVRTARRSRTYLLRAAYAVALLAALAFVYARYLGGDPLDVLSGRARAGIQDVAEFGSGFFVTFLSLQLAAVFVLTPALTATAIAEEKERRTLEYLLATDLENREIVLGKLASRLLAMLLLLISGLPVLSFVQFLGGVDPNLVLAGFAATAVTALSLGSLGVLNSVHSARPRGAVFSTYVVAGGYLVVSSCCAPWAFTGNVLNPVGWVAAGNPFVAWALLQRSAALAGGTSGAAVLSVLFQYVAFHSVVAVVMAGLATLKLRAWSREGPPKSEREVIVPRRGRRTPLTLRLRLPRVGNYPVLWKELYAEKGYRLHPLARALLLIAGAVLLLLAGLSYLCGVVVSLAAARDAPGEFASAWVRVFGTIVGGMMIVVVAVRASMSLGSERDRQTLDGLLTTPLSSSAILGGKWLGAVLSVRQAWWCLGAVWLLGFLAGGLHVLSVLLLAAAWWAYAAYAAGLGLWFSLHCRTTLRATVWTLLTLPLAGLLMAFLFGGEVPRRPFVAADVAAMTLPGGLGYLAFGWGEWHSFEPGLRSWVRQAALAWAGVCGHALAAGALWVAVRQRFGRVTGRMN